MAIPVAVPIALAAGTQVASFFNKPKYNTPDIGGELAKIGALFEKLRAQNEVNINRSAAQGRSQAANNLAARGIYRSPVAQGTFNALEGERLNALATSDAQLAGQEAEMRGGLLKTLLGLDAAAQDKKAQANAATWGGLNAIASNLALAALMRNPAPMAAGQAGVAQAPTPQLPPSQWPIFQAPQYTQVPFAPTQNAWWRQS